MNRPTFDNLKAEHRNALLLFCSAGGAQAYFGDAEIVAKRFDLIIGKSVPGRCPVTGFLIAELDQHVESLKRAGHRVVCIHQPQTAKV